MSAFFSGTDVNTLTSEGKEQNHFVSLIVNNAGNYVARITRKVISECTTTKTYVNSYKSFEDVVKPLGTTVDTSNSTLSKVEWFDLIVEKPESKLTESFLDRRMNELDYSSKSLANKYKASANGTSSSTEKTVANAHKIQVEEDGQQQLPFKETTSSTPESITENVIKQFYGDKDIDEDDDKFGVEPNLETSEVSEEDYVSDELILSHLGVLVTGDIFCTFKHNNPNISYTIYNYGENMKKLFSTRFPNKKVFAYFADSIIDFIYNEVMELSNASDAVIVNWVERIIEKLQSFPENEYSNYYITSLEMYAK